MISCHVVEIVTPKKFVLNGLWFGPKKPKGVFIVVHGLASSAFSKVSLAQQLIDRTTAVLTFSNRGHAIVTSMMQGGQWVATGGGMEHFVESEDDIDGAVRFARQLGVRNIFLMGNSTGSQKSVYWAYRKKGHGIRGLVLLVPISDWAGATRSVAERARVARAAKAARALVKARKPDNFLPSGMWVQVITAQRFLSLYTPESIEQSIFPYFDEKRRSKVFEAIRFPMIALFAGKDEYADRPAEKIAAWFEAHARTKKFKTKVIPGVGHSFRGGEQVVAKQIKRWISEIA